MPHLEPRSTASKVWCGRLLVALSLVGCGGHVDEKESDGTKVERGRLKFTNGKRSLRVAGHYLLTEGAHIYVNGSSWAPPGESGFASKMNWCDTSPNSDVEILRCFGDATENYRTTYILRMKGDKPDVQKIDEGVGSVWTDSDGRWLLFKKFYLNVETGEKIPIKGMPGADKDDGSAPVQYVIGVSPDRKTVVCRLYDTQKVGDESFITLRLINTESGREERRKVSLTKNPWLDDHENPSDGKQPPPAASKRFVWKKDGAAKDVLLVPELLDVVSDPTTQ